MKILHVIPSMAASYGGPSAALAQMQIIFDELGIQSTVATTYDSDDGVLTMSPSNRLLLFSRDFPLFYYHSKALESWLRKHTCEFDLIHIHSLFSFSSRIAGYYARHFEKPYLIEPFGTMDKYCMRRHWLRKRIYFELFERENVNKASCIRAVSVSEKEELERLNLRSKCVVVPLGVIPSVDKTGGDALGKSENALLKKKILFLSRVDPKKGLLFLLKAVNLLSRERNDFKLVIAGSGKASYVAKIKAYVTQWEMSEIVEFLGEIGGQRKVDVLNSSDIFVLPSYRENFGIAVTEAMDAGCPVIVSREVAISKEIEEVSAGLVVSPNSQQICTALNYLLNHEELRVQMGQNAKQLVQQKFDLKNNTKKLVFVYQTMLS